jgi:Bacterial Ig-like domain (group 3)
VPKVLLILIVGQLLHGQPAATVALSLLPSPSVFGGQITLTAVVTRATATGRVTFYDSTSVLGSKSLSSGTASLTTIMLSSGKRKLTAYYSGDANSAAARSNVLTQIVSTSGIRNTGYR